MTSRRLPRRGRNSGSRAGSWSGASRLGDGDMPSPPSGVDAVGRTGLEARSGSGATVRRGEGVMRAGGAEVVAAPVPPGQGPDRRVAPAWTGGFIRVGSR